MNSLQGKITDINTQENLSVVTLKISNNIYLKTIIVDTCKTAPHLQKNANIEILFKETEVIINTNTNHKTSIENTIQGCVKSIQKGALLSKVMISTEIKDINAIVNTEALAKLHLKEELKVAILIKMNEIMIS